MLTIEIPEDHLQKAAEDAIRARLDAHLGKATSQAQAEADKVLKEAMRDLPAQTRKAVENIVFEAVNAKREQILQAVEGFLGTPEKVSDMVRQKLGPAIERILQDTTRRLMGRSE